MTVRARYEITAEDKTKAGLDSASRGLSNLQGAARMLGPVLAGLGSALSVGAFAAMITSVANAADELGKLSQKTGVTVEDLSRLRYAAELSAVSNEQLSTGLRMLAKGMSEAATGTGAAADAFAAMGVEIKNTDGTLRTTREVLDDVSTRFASYADGAEKSALAQRLFGRSGADLIPLLNSGASGLREMSDESDRLGRTISTDLARASADFNDNLTRIKSSAQGVTVQIAGPLISALASLTTEFLRALQAGDSFFGAMERGLRGGLAGQRSDIAAAARDIETLTGEHAKLQAQIAQYSASGADIPGQLEFRAGKLSADLADARRNYESLAADLTRPTAAAATTAAPIVPGSGGGRGGGAAVPRLDLTRLLLDQQTLLLRDALTRQQQDLDRAYQAGITSTSDYFAERARLQTASLDAELERLRGMLVEAQREEATAGAATAAGNRARQQQVQLTGQIIVLERDRAAIAGQAARDQADAERELVRQLDDVRMRLLELTGETAQARTMMLERQYGDLIKRLQVEGDAQGEALVRKLFNVEAARAQLDQMQQQVDLAMARMSTGEQTIAVQRETGLLSESQARRELVALHQATSAEVQRLIPLMHELAAATGDPMAIERVRQLEVRLQSLAVTADEVAQRINAAIETGLSDALHDFAMGTKTASEAFRSFADSVVKEINKIASQRLAESLLGMFGTTGGGSGGIGGFISGLLKHSGGVVGEGGQFRRIPGFAFAGAPRYHNGGIAGLRPDEVPAILRKREEVLTEDDPRHRANGGLGGTGGGAPAADRMRFVLVDNRDNIADHLRSAEGEQVFVEMLQRNASVIRNL